MRITEHITMVSHGMTYTFINSSIHAFIQVSRLGLLCVGRKLHRGIEGQLLGAIRYGDHLQRLNNKKSL